MADDKRRQFGIERIQARELPEPVIVKQPGFKEVVVQERVSRDKMYGKKFDPPTMKAKQGWAYRRKLVRGKSIPVKGSK